MRLYCGTRNTRNLRNDTEGNANDADYANGRKFFFPVGRKIFRLLPPTRRALPYAECPKTVGLGRGGGRKIFRLLHPARRALPYAECPKAVGLGGGGGRKIFRPYKSPCLLPLTPCHLPLTSYLLLLTSAQSPSALSSCSCRLLPFSSRLCFTAFLAALMAICEL